MPTVKNGIERKTRQEKNRVKDKQNSLSSAAIAIATTTPTPTAAEAAATSVIAKTTTKNARAYF